MELKGKRAVIGDAVLVFMFSALFSIYIAAIMFQNANDYKIGSMDEVRCWLLNSPARLLFVLVMFGTACFLGKCCIWGGEGIGRVYAYRIPFTLLIALIYVWLGLNNTSLVEWTRFLPGADKTAPLWGVSRTIRSDEWAVWSTFVFAQASEAFPSSSSLISGGNIDVSWISVGGVPAWNMVAAFKPLYWGFLLFGLEKGYSILAISRILLLFWTSYAFAMHYTGGKRWFSLTAAIMLTFAPYVQWWFSQSISEVLIYAQGMILTGSAYIHAAKRNKCFLAVLFAYLLGCYIMIAYPGWLISVAYVVVALLVFEFIRHRKKLHIADVLALMPVLVVVFCLLRNVYATWDTLQAVSSSVYPGERLFTGKYLTHDFYTGLFSLIFPLNSNVPYMNVCELSNFLTFSPAGLLLTLYLLIVKKRKEPFALVLLAVEAFLAFFLLCGVSPAFAETTLLSQCTRMLPAISLIDTILLFRGLSFMEKLPALHAAAMALFSSVIFWYPGASRLNYPKDVSLPVYALGLLLFCLIYFNDNENRKSVRRVSYAMICCALLAGGFVNPISKGIDQVMELDLVRELKKLPDDALYLMESGAPYTNAPLLAGKRCYNSTSVYPNCEKWAVLDPEGEYEEVYNRFCNVDTVLVDEDSYFELIGLDHIQVYVSFSDLEKLSIDYLITANDYDGLIKDGVRFVHVVDAAPFRVYQLFYDGPL